MATYKVIQDIEAEDKLLGPFSLRQFIYLLIVAVTMFLGYKLSSASVLLIIPLLPIIIFFALLAAPFGRDQSSEVWLLAKIRFFIKPRKRIWNQDGIQQLVTITAPKKIEAPRTKNLTQTEVKSRLQALASTIDTRGWAVKDVDVSMFAHPSLLAAAPDSDRLIAAETFTQVEEDIAAPQDMFDEQTNPTTQNLDQLMHASSQAHRQQIVDTMKQSAQAPAPTSTSPGGPPPDYWFLNSNAGAPQTSQPGSATFQGNPLIAPGTNDTSAPITPPPMVPPQPVQGKKIGVADEQALLAQLHAAAPGKPAASVWNHLRTIKPLAEQQTEAEAAAREAAKKAAEMPPQPPVTARPDPAILELANNDDLNVATIARQANKAKDQKEPPSDEVVISLH
ncbi:MAG TPA: PrgI family protein [Verrucomicrobiae bacterium]|nr:PrgI family protein [Verrucomicrobiae bacterium]